MTSLQRRAMPTAGNRSQDQQTLTFVGTLKNMTVSDILTQYISYLTDEQCEQIATISTLSTSENALKDKFYNVFMESWESISLTIEENANTGIPKLTQIDEILVELDDCRVSLASIEGSRYVQPILPQVEQAENSLKVFIKLLNELNIMQGALSYQTIVFREPDIRRQLPEDPKVFMKIRSFWNKLISEFLASPFASKISTKYNLGMKSTKHSSLKLKNNPNSNDPSSRQGNLVALVQQYNADLEVIQKHIQLWLDVKRQAFSRFYFLNNDELLSILSQSKDPRAIQPHLSKCFEGLYAVEFAEKKDPDNPLKDIPPDTITGFRSAEGEIIHLRTKIKCRGAVEKWASQLESEMKIILRQLCKKSVVAYSNTPRDEWSTQHAGQLVLVVSAIYFCKEVEEALTLDTTINTASSITEKEKRENLLENLTKLRAKQIGKLTALSNIVRTDCPSLVRKALSALMTMDVHHREILDLLIHECKLSIVDPNSLLMDRNSFVWKKQLRYYWDSSDEDVNVEMVSSSFKYGWEYLGCSPRLVVTSLTGRCYVTCLSAIAQNLGASPQGPAGTGKTETVKDLAKAMGLQCVVFNCGDTLDASTMGRFFSGLAQTGAWVCFDEFNRLRSDVLSVVATQLLTIRRAILGRAKTLEFEGENIRLSLDPTMAVFITMNPGYAGRAELPANLKALFRPVSMMRADYERIAEVMLFSQGFQESTVLARKMFQLFQLSAQQLSPQKHYDFGMRAIKSLLVMAGSLKRASPNVPEHLVLIRALRDSNLPKFVAKDLPLFQGLISDIWPGLTLPEQSRIRLEKMITALMYKRYYRPLPQMIKKVIQFYDTLIVRHGAVIVGPPGTGKTVILEILAAAMEELGKQDESSLLPSEEKGDFQPIHIHHVHPKAISPGELYGEFITDDKWSDGIVAKGIKTAAADPSQDYHWILFDGPVDAVYIENMNTSLDDNKMLCLDNGERIKMSAQTRLIFEVTDLSEASPATISRCGMVYVGNEILPVVNLVYRWLLRSFGFLCYAPPDIITSSPIEIPAIEPCNPIEQHLAQQLWALVDIYLDDAISLLVELNKSVSHLDHEKHNLALNRTQSMLSLLSAFLDPNLQRTLSTENTDNVNSRKSRSFVSTLKLTLSAIESSDTTLKIRNWFMFCFVWGLGSGLKNPKHRATFSEWILSSFDFDTELLSPNTTIFDYCYVAKTNTFVLWTDPSLGIFKSFSYSSTTPWQQIVVPTSDVIKYTYFSNALLRIGQSVLITGSPSIGKTLVSNQIIKSVQDCYIPFSATLNPTSKPDSLVDLAEQRLDRLTPTTLGGRNGKRVLMVLDDMHRVQRETYGALGSLEMARQFLEYHGFHDRETRVWKEIKDISSLSIRTDVPCDGLGNKDMSSARFMRHFTHFHLPDPSINMDTISIIYSTITTHSLLYKLAEDEEIKKTTGVSKFKLKKPEIEALSSLLIQATSFVFSWVLESFIPKPDTPHYRFSLRDIDNVYLGIFSGSKLYSDKQICRIWMHEMFRVFGDRLTSQHEISSFTEVMMKACNSIITVAATLSNDNSSINPEFLCEPFWSDIDISGSQPTQGSKRAALPITYGAFSPSSPSEYVEIDQRKEPLASVFADYADSASFGQSSNSEDSLIFFQDACIHLSRISRCLFLPSVNSLLVGPSGTGKRSLVRFACQVFNIRVLEIRASKSYRLESLFDDLKSLCMTAGIDNRKVAVLVPADSLDSTFLEAINTLINSYEIPYFPEDMEAIYSAVRVAALSQHTDPTPLDNVGLFKFFLQRVAQNLTVFVTTSPDVIFRERVRQFPSFLRCQIDWFEMWPKDALFAIATKLVHPITLEFQEAVTPFLSVFNSSNSKNKVDGNDDTETGDDTNSTASIIKTYTHPKVNTIVSLAVFFHSSALVAASKMKTREKRSFIITPGVFLEFLSLAFHFTKKFSGNALSGNSRLALGIEKLKSTNASVQKMQIQLKALQPVLEEKSKATEAILAQVKTDTTKANSIQEVVNKEAEKIAKETEKVSVIAQDAQKDLDAALPALAAAVESLNNLNSSDISEVKAFSNPPTLVKTVMEAICILFSVEPNWKNSKLVLGQTGFIKKLIDYDKDNIPDSIINKLKPYIDNPSFVPEVVSKVSKAATSLCLWARSMSIYNKVIKVVAPKRAKLAEANATLATLQAQLDTKQQQLDEIKSQIAKLETKLAATLKEKETLAEQVAQTEIRLNRAQDLIVNLSDEAVRWKFQFEEAGPALLSCLASGFLSAAIVGYLGPFSSIWRTRLIKIWTKRVKKLLFFHGSESWDPLAVLSSDVEIRQWQSQGLPLDQNSSVSAVLIQAGIQSRWPLIIDPQEQAKNWIMHKESNNNVMILSAVDASFIKYLRNAVENGYPVLLQDVDPGIIESNIQTLEPILLRSTITQGSRTLLKIGDDVLEYSPDFKLYMTTTINSPTYSPTVFSLVNVINFSISASGFENQLLSYVVKARKPELENQADMLVKQMAEDRSTLKALEDKILELLSQATGNILDDEELINILKSSKIKSREISNRMVLTAETSANIEVARNVFRNVANHSVILYNVVSSLGNIDTLYIYSLASFITVFVRVLESGDGVDPIVAQQHAGTLKEPDYAHKYTFVQKSSSEQEKLTAVCEKLTWAVYSNYSRGLFNRDKLGFSAAIALATLKVDPKLLWVMLNSLSPTLLFTPKELARAENLVETVSSSISDTWITKAILLKALVLSAVFPKKLPGLSGDIVSHPGEWETFLNSPTFVTAKITRWNTLCNGSRDSQLLKLCLLSQLKPSQSNYSISQYVCSVLGSRYVLNSPLDVSTAFSDSSPSIPIFYLLVPGIDPTSQTFALVNQYKSTMTSPNMIPLDSLNSTDIKTSNNTRDNAQGTNASDETTPKPVMTEYDIQLVPISLGQGILPRAMTAVKKGMKRGDWVFLQNLHLVPDFLSDIASIVSTISSAAARGIQLNPHFRLFLSAEPCSFLPPSILKYSLKLSQQPPTGIRNTVALAYESLSSTNFSLFGSVNANESSDTTENDNDNTAIETFTNTPSAIEVDCWPRLLFNLFVANALINCRLIYGPLGMNIQTYGFGIPDLNAATFCLRDSLIRTITNGGTPKDIPWNELNYMTSEICYGGRVTDDWDRVLISTLIRRFYNPTVLQSVWNWENLQPLSPGADFQQYSTFIQNSFPPNDAPHHFWLDSNADLALQTDLSKALLETISRLQPDVPPPALRTGPKPNETKAIESESESILSLHSKTMTPNPGRSGSRISKRSSSRLSRVSSSRSSSSKTDIFSVNSPGTPGKSRSRNDDTPRSKTPNSGQPQHQPQLQGMDRFSSTASLLFETENELPLITQPVDPIVSRITTILNDIPEFIEPLESFNNPDDPLNSAFLSLEIEQANLLLKEMKNSLHQSLLVLDGQAVAKETDNATIHALRVGKVPPWWKLFSYETPKVLLDFWLQDFYKRISFIRFWRNANGPLKSYWLPGLFDQRAFLKFVLQLHARRFKIPLDDLGFTWKVKSGWYSAKDVPEAPQEGVYIRGLFLDAARWNDSLQTLDVQLPNSLFSRLPVLHLLPRKLDSIPMNPPNSVLTAPLYKTPVRQGLISTTGLSTNFIIEIPLPIKKQTETDDWILRSTALLCTLENELEE